MRTFITLTFLSMSFVAQSQSPGHYQDVYSVYITKDLKGSAEFYRKWLGFEIAFEASWFIYMRSQGDQPFSFALIGEDHPSSPPTYGAFNGRGSFFTLQVEDATALYHKLKGMGAPITYDLTKEDWGQIRFGLTDPNGLYVDIVQQVEPLQGYWEKYLPK